MYGACAVWCFRFGMSDGSDGDGGGDGDGGAGGDDV